MNWEVHWFGEPWGAGGRAPICESDDNKMSTPVGTKCIECTKPIKETSQGIVCLCSPAIWGHWIHVEDGLEIPVASYHLHCWLQEVVGGEMSAKLMNRMRFRESAMISKLRSDTAPRDVLADPHWDETGGEVVPGRGWGKTEEGQEDL